MCTKILPFWLQAEHSELWFHKMKHSTWTAAQEFPLHSQEASFQPKYVQLLTQASWSDRKILQNMFSFTNCPSSLPSPQVTPWISCYSGTPSRGVPGQHSRWVTSHPQHNSLPTQPRAAQGRDWTQHRLRLQLRSDLSFRQYQHIKHIKERPLERRLPRQQCVLALCKAQNKVVPCKQKFIHTPSSLLPPGTPWEKPKLLLSLTHWSSGFLNLGTVWRFCSCLHRTWDWRRLLWTPKALFSQMSTTKSCMWTTDWHIPQDCPHWNVHSHNTIPEKQPKPRKLKFSVVMKTQARNCNALRHLYPAAIKRTQNELCEWFHAFNVQTKCLHLSWQVSLLGCRMNGKIYKHLRLYFPNCSEQPSHRL